MKTISLLVLTILVVLIFLIGFQMSRSAKPLVVIGTINQKTQSFAESEKSRSRKVAHADFYRDKGGIYSKLASVLAPIEAIIFKRVLITSDPRFLFFSNSLDLRVTREENISWANSLGEKGLAEILPSYFGDSSRKRFEVFIEELTRYEPGRFRFS